MMGEVKRTPSSDSRLIQGGTRDLSSEQLSGRHAVKLAVQLVALLVIVWPLQLHAAANAVSLELAQLNAIELEALEPFPDFVVLSGDSEHGEKVLHRGEVVVSIYGAKPALLDISVPFPYDEFVWILDGEQGA
jgi:hypothetical protein